ncbi:hypothetical protein BD779DRAFT_1678817 [Infundibulicybe gibba]|nr:hypothetical protein BD779DRAFT_1678817 [Infundibulicybe gibba]
MSFLSRISFSSHPQTHFRTPCAGRVILILMVATSAARLECTGYGFSTEGLSVTGRGVICIRPAPSSKSIERFEGLLEETHFSAEIFAGVMAEDGWEVLLAQLNINAL